MAATRLGFACLFLMFGLPFPMATAADQPAGTPAAAPSTTLTFLMAHKPDNADNVALIKEFADKVSSRTQGSLIIQPITLDDGFRAELVRGGSDSHGYALKKLYAGQVGLSQISVKKFSEFTPEIDVLDMPYVFKNHAHAAKVLDGDIGSRLRDSVLADSNGNVRALAFTYSGGFRSIYSTKDINAAADLKGMPMRLRPEPAARDAMDFLGLAQFPAFGNDISSGWVAKHADPEGLAEEAEIIRITSYRGLWPEEMKRIKTVLETNHSLFLTLLAVNGQAYDKLSPQQQVVLREEANTLAKKERELSIRQAAQGKADMAQAGIKFVALSEEDTMLMEQMAQHVHKKYQNEVGSWIAAIKAAADERVLTGQ